MPSVGVDWVAAQWRRDADYWRHRSQRLNYELREAQAEIARHHKDFERIRAAVDSAIGTWDYEDPQPVALLREIRMIIG